MGLGRSATGIPNPVIGIWSPNPKLPPATENAIANANWSANSIGNGIRVWIAIKNESGVEIAIANPATGTRNPSLGEAAMATKTLSPKPSDPVVAGPWRLGPWEQGP